ncbi:MAG: hypothetical protein Q9182_000918 [Xanthomendoza sp. 2 TL-2023]
MHLYAALLLYFVASVISLQNPHSKARARVLEQHQNTRRSLKHSNPPYNRVDGDWESQYLTSDREKFKVNGSSLFGVDFDFPESYAGLLPNGPSGNSSLFFWFFPGTPIDSLVNLPITIWLNGGPGCSSLGGLLLENGPFLWQPGTYEPIENPWAWTQLTNMVWVDQPAGTGFSPGPASVDDEIDVANQFNDFWRNFVTTFNLQNYAVILTGESYAGQYIPYIAENMLNRSDPTYYNLRGIQINDPVINELDTLAQAPAVMYVNEYSNIFGLNDTFMADINQRAKTCGYTDFMNSSLQFPPTGPLRTAPTSETDGCDVWDSIVTAAYYVNPCFSVYHITDFCPYLYDVLGFPSLNPGPINYFNRSDVQAALHVPPTDYSVCSEYNFLRPDKSVPSGLGPLPRVIEALNNTIIAHGMLDFILIANGTLATIQNMTWNGAQGFQTAPSSRKNFFVPYHRGLREVAEGVATVPFVEDAGAGYLGTAHTERGLTFVTVDLAGHMIPFSSPGAAFRQLEFLLGRIPSLSEIGEYPNFQEVTYYASPYGDGGES